MGKTSGVIPRRRIRRLAAPQKLNRAPFEVTLIDRRNFHLFQPLLYQVATGSLSPGEIAAPLRGVLSSQKNTLVLLGEAEDVDPQVKRVRLRDGACFEIRLPHCCHGNGDLLLRQ